jgi:hypothetical protein
MKDFDNVIPDSVTDTLFALPTPELVLVLARGTHDLFPERAFHVKTEQLGGSLLAHPAADSGAV